MERWQEGANTELNKKEESIMQIVKPMKESLEKVDSKIQELEKWLREVERNQRVMASEEKK